MVKTLLQLEWKAFRRSKSFGANLIIKILIAIGVLYTIGLSLLLGIGGYYIISDLGLPVFSTFNKFFIYYWTMDLFLRYMMLKSPSLSIRPLIYQNIKRNFLVKYALGKSFVNVFNLLPILLIVPFTIVYVKETGAAILPMVLWTLSLVGIIWINSLLSLLVENFKKVFFVTLGLLAISSAAHYFNYFDLTIYSELFFTFFHRFYWAIIAVIIVKVILTYVVYRFYIGQFYLDTGLTHQSKEALSIEAKWLDRYGVTGQFLRNDLRLILRNKRAKHAILSGIFFLFYGLLFMNPFQPDMYQSDGFKLFSGIFVTGGFLFTFGQYVPSWDSSYYPFMMTQNISYKKYLESKWLMVVVTTLISTLLASFYMLMGWDVYKFILAGSVYNIGINSYLVLLTGAFVKSPIDLTKAQNAFGDKKAFNAKTFLMILPKLVLPVILYYIGSYFGDGNTGILTVVVFSILALVFRNKVFLFIENLYQNEKYDTIEAYKQKN